MRRIAALRGTGGVLVFLLLWEATVRTGVLQGDYLSAPSAVAQSLARLMTTASVLGEIAHTLGAALAGWAIAAALGVALGAALGVSPVLRTYTMTTVELLRPLPPVALVPVALLLFGFSIRTELVVIVIPGIFPVLVGTMGGVLAVPQRLRDVARSLRLSPAEIICKILIPAAAPSLLVGCRLALSMSLVLAVVVEMIGNPQGLGYAVVREAQGLDRDTMYAYVFIIGLLGILLNACLVAASKALLPGEFNRPQGVAAPA